MALDQTTKIRRLTRILRDFSAVDLTQPNALEILAYIQSRCTVALSETALGRGNPGLEFARQQARAANRREGRATEDRIRPILKQLRDEGLDTYEALAAELNRRKIRPPQAKRWSRFTVRAIEIRHPNE